MVISNHRTNTSSFCPKDGAVYFVRNSNSDAKKGKPAFLMKFWYAMSIYYCVVYSLDRGEANVVAMYLTFDAQLSCFMQYCTVTLLWMSAL